MAAFLAPFVLIKNTTKALKYHSKNQWGNHIRLASFFATP